MTTKNVTYFRDIPDSIKQLTIKISDFKDPQIQPDDILSIVIQTIDPQSSSTVNQPNAAPIGGTNTISGNAAPTTLGYLIDKNGIVSIPIIGDVKLAGMSTSQARDAIREKAEKYYISPNVQVRFANFKITVIGEVMKPATYTVPNERVSVLDAIGFAGDLSIYGKRENILLIRDSVGAKQFVRLNLNSSELFKSPYFYLRQNDVIYVEPNEAKIATTDAARTRTLAVMGSVISLLIVIAARLLR